MDARTFNSNTLTFVLAKKKKIKVWLVYAHGKEGNHIACVL